eukprot:247153_1
MKRKNNNNNDNVIDLQKALKCDIDAQKRRSGKTDEQLEENINKAIEAVCQEVKNILNPQDIRQLVGKDKIKKEQIIRSVTNLLLIKLCGVEKTQLDLVSREEALILKIFGINEYIEYFSYYFLNII